MDLAGENQPFRCAGVFAHRLAPCRVQRHLASRQSRYGPPARPPVQARRRRLVHFPHRYDFGGRHRAFPLVLTCVSVILSSSLADLLRAVDSAPPFITEGELRPLLSFSPPPFPSYAPSSPGLPNFDFQPSPSLSLTSTLSPPQSADSPIDGNPFNLFLPSLR